METLCNTSLEISSPFVSRLSDNGIDCCTTDQTALRRCCSCSFKCFNNHSKWSSILLLQIILPIC